MVSQKVSLNRERARARLYREGARRSRARSRSMSATAARASSRLVPGGKSKTSERSKGFAKRTGAASAGVVAVDVAPVDAGEAASGCIACGIDTEEGGGAAGVSCSRLIATYLMLPNEMANTATVTKAG